MSNSLQPHWLQHARLSYPSLSPGVCSNSCPLSQWCHPTISSSLLPHSFNAFNLSQHQGLFPTQGHELSLHIRWPTYWSFDFSISPSSEYSGLMSFMVDWFDLLAVQGTQESSPAPEFKNINSLALSLLYCSALTSLIFLKLLQSVMFPQSFLVFHNLDTLEEYWSGYIL